MFRDTINVVSSNLIPAAVLFFSFLLALGTFLQRNQVSSLFKGLVHLIYLAVISPLQFLRKTVSEVTDSEGHEERDGLNSDQFLLRRNYSSLKAALITGAVLTLALGLNASWIMLPSRDDFKERRLAQENITELTAERESFEKMINGFQKIWPRVRKSFLSQDYFEAEARLARMRTERVAMEPRLRTEIRQHLAQDQGIEPLERYGSREKSAYYFYTKEGGGGYYYRDPVAYSYFDRLGNEQVVANWLLEDEAKTRSVRLFRLDLLLLANSSRGEELRANQTRERAAHELIGGKRRSAMRAFLLTILAFYGTAWGLGLLIELLGLVIRVAGDIRVIRDQATLESQEVLASERKMIAYSAPGSRSLPQGPEVLSSGD